MAAYKHIKTGNVYEVLFDDAIECTNGREDMQYVVYRNARGKVFVREYDEFMNKFVLCDGAVHD